MRYLIRYSLLMLLFICKPVATYSQQAYSLSLDELFRLGTENSLRLQASRMEEVIAGDKEKTAKTSRLPGISIGAMTGYIGQSTVFRKGLAQPVHPDLPDWSHNYNVEVTQPVYRGGKIHYNIKRASLEKEIATLNSTNSEAEIKLLLLRRYMDLFSLYKQRDVFARNVEESTRRLDDIRRLKKEGVVTRNDELRSELQLTNDQLACREADDDISIVSQQLDVLLGLDESLLLQPDTTLLYTAVSLEDYEIYVLQAYSN